jgi:hypothetical protein
MAAENQELRTGFRVPQPDGAIVATRGDAGSVRTEGNARNRFGVTVDCELLSACLHIPYFDGLVGTSRNDPRAIGTEVDATNFIGMPGDDPRFLTGPSIPNANRFIGASWPLTGSHSLMVVSKLADASRLPWGLNSKLSINSVCPRSVWAGSKDRASHRFTVKSWLADARDDPSGLKATLMQRCE